MFCRTKDLAAKAGSTSCSSWERENEKPAAQNRLGRGASRLAARRLPTRRSMPSAPKWLARSSVGRQSSGTCASGPSPWAQHNSWPHQKGMHAK